MQKIRQFIDKNYQMLSRIVITAREFTGYVLLYWGEGLLGVRQKYRLISTIIEHILQGRDVRVQVIKAFEEPLSVRFQLKVSVPSPYDIDGDYFKRELALQLGCQLSDIATDIEGGVYYVSITKTAIGNMEKGCTPYMPQVYEASFVDELFEEARQIVLAEGKGTAEILQDRLKIGYARAARLLDELETQGVLTPGEGNKPRKLVN